MESAHCGKSQMASALFSSLHHNPLESAKSAFALPASGNGLYSEEEVVAAIERKFLEDKAMFQGDINDLTVRAEK